jgi:4-hydroxythreonine-4-phosphate dehydrogenase
MEKDNKPIIGITMGDPAGIGPEITLKALNKREVTDICRPLIIGDTKALDAASDFSKLKVKLRSVKSIDEADFDDKTINVYDLDNVNLNEIEYGKISAQAGRAAYHAVETAIQLALDNKVNATVTGPINKESINLAGFHYSGHTEIYAKLTNTSDVAMLLVHGNLRVIHVTTHVSLKKACDLIKKERIIKVIKLLQDACNQLGVASPKIGVAGLNPHASDGGLFGDEEKNEILPAIEQARVAGIDTEGPVPADSLFPKALGGYYDGCVAMYHDQGHIPFKLIGFSWDDKKQSMSSVKGVNITLGIPIIRTSVDHGTAFEIAGRGIASEEAMVHAIEYAVKMASQKRI